MLPQHEKKTVSLIMAKRAGKAGHGEMKNEVQAPESGLHPGLLAAAEDAIRAHENKSPHDLARAHMAMFDVLDSMKSEPSEEGLGDE